MPTSGSSHLQGDALLGRAAVQPEGLPVATHEVDLLVGTDATQRRTPLGEQHQPVVARQVPDEREIEYAVSVELVELAGAHLQLAHAGVAGVGVTDRLRPVFLGVQADGGGLDPQRQVLGDQRDPVTFVGQVVGHRQDPGVVVTEPEAGGERRRVGVVELDPDGATFHTDRHRSVEAPVFHTQFVEHAQRRTREIAQLGVVAFGLELGNDDHRKDDLVLGEPPQRAGIGQQHAGVEDVGTALRA